MSEQTFEPNEEPLDEDRVVEDLDEPDLPVEDDDPPPAPDDPETVVHRG